MTGRKDHDRLLIGFRQLRQQQSRLAPSYQQLLRRKTVRRSDQDLFRTIGQTVAVLVVLVIVAVYFIPASKESSFDSAQLNDNIQLTSMHKLPTDFLLTMPGLQLENMVPRFQLKSPLYIRSEERANEM